MRELLRLLAKRRTEASRTDQESEVASLSSQADPHETEDVDLIDLSDSPVLPPTTASLEKKKPPMKPKKPRNLQSSSSLREMPSEPQFKEVAADAQSKGSTRSSQRRGSPPPVSAPPSSNVSSDGNLMIDEYRPPLPPRRSRTTLRNGYDYDPDSIYDSPGFMELEDRDKKGAEWVRRVSTAITALKNTNTQIHIFMDSDDQFFESSCNKLDEDVRVK